MKSDDVVSALSALAQHSRLAAFRLLVKRGPEGFTPGEMSQRLEIPAPTLSFHLKTLHASGLVEVRRDGRNLIYSASLDRMHHIVGFLTEHCCSLATDGTAASCAPTRKSKGSSR